MTINADDGQTDHISDVRRMLIEQLRSLRSADPSVLQREIRRARAVAEVAQVVVNTARVEVDYIAAVRGASDSSFLQAPDEQVQPRLPTKPQSPLPSVDDPARLGGPSKNHPWRAGVSRDRE